MHPWQTLVLHSSLKKSPLPADLQGLQARGTRKSRRQSGCILPGGTTPLLCTPQGPRTSFLWGVERSLGSRAGAATGHLQGPSRCWIDPKVGSRGETGGREVLLPLSLGPLNIRSGPTPLLPCAREGAERGGKGALTQASGVLAR